MYTCLLYLDYVINASCPKDESVNDNLSNSLAMDELRSWTW